MASRLNTFPEHCIVVPFGHHVPSPPENHLEQSVVGLNGAVVKLLEDLNGFLNDAGAAVTVDQGDEHVLVVGEGLLGEVEEDAASVVELGVAGEDLNHLEGGVSVVGEQTGTFDPAVEAEGLVGVVGGTVEDVPDEGAVEPGDDGPDRVL